MTDDPEKIKVITMDKKGSFPSSFATNTNKSLALDNSAKTTAYSRQDGTSGSQISKVQPKTPTRYRGNQTSNTGGFSRNEAYNRYKPTPQKGKYADRKPKPKGGQSASESVAQKETEPEGATSHPPGGKKQNIKDQDLDLWGFQYAPLQSHGYVHGHLQRRSRPSSGGPSRSNYGAGPIRPKYSKDYLLAK
ncbi:hypothetical protein Ocin01_06198 [Orchesella cincta]|uniref:Uncharacterized protein n=1 Tax=Orchesella cincta TaxID=48709 RepID=A0A1D2N5D5_ORCCI|nr:hypothetical protein Ocin01_06198 [Orchesella cincta]